jgi:hypothetical protein
MRRLLPLSTIFLGMFSLCACSSHVFGKSDLRTRPKLFVGHYAGGAWTPEWSHFKDVRQSCPEAVVIWDRDAADYQLNMYWSEGHWASQLLRNDSADMLEEDSPDFNRIVRDSCKAVLYDSLEWRAPLGADTAARGESPDRYDLRELHNGALSTSAMIDKKTGKVWIWTSLTENGKKTGKTAFLSEEVVPEPEK